MRIDIVAHGDGPWQIVVERDKDELARFEMRVLDGGLPAPAEGGLDAVAFATALRAVRNDIAERSDVIALGEHLFSAIIEPAWSAIEERLGDAHLFELGLVLARGSLRGVPWELMCRNGEFLSAGLKLDARIVDVAITRRVLGATASYPTLRQPLRYMFVVGTELGDAVRAGAETLGLLRQIAPVVRDHFVQRESPARLRTEVAAFEPHVVHIICHGRSGPQGVELEMWDDDTRAAKFVGATELVGCLVRRRGDIPVVPTVVVLSACSSGQRIDAASTNDLATSLVEAGVPMVVAMSAEIRDVACRLFTRRMGRAAIDREPLLAAAIAGRRLTLREPDLVTSFDWGMIQVLLRSDVDGDIAVDKCEPGSDEALVLNWLRLAGLPLDVDSSQRNFAPLCAATDVISGFWKLMSNQSQAAMVIQAYPQLKPGTNRLLRVGKRRAFAEIVAAAIRAGHVPVVVMPNRTRYPTTPARLVEELRAAFERARGWRDLPARDPLPGLSDNPSERELHRALESEAFELQTDACARHDFIRRSNGEVVIMLHDVHLYSAAASLALSLLGGAGAGLGRRVRTVISWAHMTSSDPAWRAQNEDELAELLRTGATWISRVALRALSLTDAKLAYQRLLLHPYRSEPAFATQQWFLDLKDPTDPHTIGAIRLMHKGTEGFIGAIDDPDFLDWFEEATIEKHVRVATDDFLLGLRK